MSENITAKTCTRKAASRTRIFDARCSGFYVSIQPKGTATFAFKYWDTATNKQASITLGDYHPEHLPVEKARALAFDLKGRVGRGEDIRESASQAKAQRGKLAGVTVGTVIDEFIEHISTPVTKADGKKRPRIESWKCVERWLERNVRPVIGNRTASEVTNNDIARIQAAVAKRSTSSARQTRSALNRLFKFAAEAGRSYITTSPCFNLPSLDKEYERTRVLNMDEIRTLWWGLDHKDLPCHRSIALALKFELVTMLRSQEVRAARRDLVKDGVLKVPAEFVKKRRVIEQPLNSLAMEIIAEATAKHNHDLIFSIDGSMLGRGALHFSVSGKNGQRVRKGIVDFLGMEPFTPHDLRRTAATLAGEIGCSTAVIAKCLDHSKDRGEDVVEVPTVTGRVYEKSKRVGEKRAVMDAIDKKLREIIGPRPVKLRLVG